MDGGNTVCFHPFGDHVEAYLLINLPPYVSTPCETNSTIAAVADGSAVGHSATVILIQPIASVLGLFLPELDKLCLVGNV